MRSLKFLTLIASGIVTIGMFQNCSRNGIMIQDSIGAGKLGVCGGVSCELTPLTSKAAVTTILMALGDQADHQLVVNGGSAQLIAETVVRYSTPVEKPKILLVRDMNAGIESAEDTTYALEVLLGRYDVTFMQEPDSGIQDADLAGYDLVWFNNPGAPLGLASTQEVLKRFHGGVVIQGDDLSWGLGFKTESLTGLKHIDNGTAVRCEGMDYGIDGNAGYQYRVTLNSAKIPGADNATLSFVYGNDIDNTSVARDDLEILAKAKGDIASCVAERPAIVRYTKE